jgi:riboflavin kinase/FMN adenylyltransferase
MKILHGLNGLRQLPPGAILSIGNFDGVHVGHQHIMRTAGEFLHQTGGAGVAVVTFEPHPLTVLRPELAPPRITPLELKQKLLADLGADYLVILPPTHDVLDLAAEKFWEILRDDVRPTHLVEGGQFNFGKDRRGTIDRLREWSAGTEVKLHVIDPVSAGLLDMQLVAVSSSVIRWLIAHGRMRDAAICLGRAYVMEGQVVKGHQRGRTIGVPTANLACADQIIPADGVYAGRCAVDGRVYPAAISIGNLPTFDDGQFQIEAHLVGFDGDLYDRTLRLEIIDWIREQRKFLGIDALKARIRQDIVVAVEHVNCQPHIPIAVLT